METYENNPETGGGKMLWIIGGIVLVLAIIGIVYSATQKTIKKTGTDADNVPVTQNDTDTAVAGDSTKMPAGHVASTVTYTGFDVVNLQSFPYRVQVRVRGTVPEGCVVAQTPSATVSGKTFTVAMTTSKPADAVCTQQVKNVEGVVELPVSGLAAGSYSVKVGTMAAKSFTLAANNTIQYSGDK